MDAEEARTNQDGKAAPEADPKGRARDSGPFEDSAALVDGVKRGDERACAQLVRQYAPRMLAAARRLLGDETAAEDCIQEAFISAFRGIDKFEARANIGTWLHRIAVNAALMKLRSSKRRREQAIDDLLPEFDAHDCRIEPSWNIPDSAEDLVERKEIRELVLSKVRELPENYRTVFMLRDIEDMDTKDVAELLGISEGAVKVRLHRARAALKKLLEPVWKGQGR